MWSTRTRRRGAAATGVAVVLLGAIMAVVLDRRQHLQVVEDVLDGDTIRIRLRGHDRLVQLAGVDAPERHMGPTGEPGAQLARAYLRQRLLHRTVWIEAVDPGRPLDAKGRLLSWVWLDGDNICYELVATGLARFSGAAEAPHRDVLVALQNGARAQRRGIWALDGVEPGGGRAPNRVELRIKEHAEQACRAR